MTSANDLFEKEKVRLMDALGSITDGGILETIQHIGSTSVPGLNGSDCVDIGASVWPFPLEAEPRSKLESLGYQAAEGFNDKLQFFRHESSATQLLFAEAGTEDWFNLVLVRDYLLHNEAVRDDVSAKRSKGIADKPALFPQLIHAGHNWWIEHYGFSRLERITNELMDANFQWLVAGGWAIDLFLGRVQRMHHDVDIIVERDAQMELQKYLLDRNWKLITPFNKRFDPWHQHMRIELPRHQVHAHREDEFIDILLSEMDDVWRYRRDPVIIRSKEKMSMKTEKNIPYLSPELVLLFKSRNTGDHERAKDETDFQNTLAHLDDERRAWLHWALTATTPEHSWLKQLTDA